MKDLPQNILITGAAGFIGSFFASALNEKGIESLILVDDFSSIKKAHHHQSLKCLYKIHRDQLMDWLENPPVSIDIIIHLGARTDTTEFDEKLLKRLNTSYTKDLWEFATQADIPFLYASSAATYGDGAHGYDDDLKIKSLEKLTPLNPYGWSKHKVDLWALAQKKTPPFWAGFKFFNVYGPHEDHKSRMASVIFHAFYQIQATGEMKLFKSHRSDYENGGQQRDFIYVKDVVNILVYFMENHAKIKSGIYNVGTGTARSFNDLAKGVFTALNQKPKITYIDTPEDIRDKYQYFTEATSKKLVEIGYNQPFYSLEEGIKDYIQHYLLDAKDSE